MTATLLPNAKAQFLDGNGKPLAGGSVYFYIPNTSTKKDTYQDPQQTILNTNPIILDASGEAIIWGAGTYRQVVYDQYGNLIWDQITSDVTGGLLGDMVDNVFIAGTDFTPGTTTVLNLTAAPGSIPNTWIYFDAAYQDDAQATVVGKVLTFASPIPVGVGKVTVKIGSTVAIGTPGDGTVTDASVAPGAAINSSKLSYNEGGAGAATRTVRSRLQDFITLKDFPVKGDGVTDDSAAIQNATNEAAAAGKKLFLPAGVYCLKSFVTWPAGTSWVGEPGTQIYLDPAMTLGINIGGLNRGLYNTGAGSLLLDGIVFASSKVGLTQSVSIAIEHAVGVRITNCTFQNFGNSGFYAQGFIAFQTSDIRLLNSRFYNCSGDGAALASNIVNFNVSGCEFSQNGDWGLALSVGVTQGTVQGNMFIGNFGTAVGADRCTDVAFIGNTMVNNAHGVRVCKFGATPDVNRNITISGNNILNAGSIGISVEQSGDFNTGANANISVTGNTITGSGGQGINVNDSTDVAVVGNAVFSTVSEGILMNAFTAGWETGRITVSGNKIDTCAYGIRQLTGSGTASRSTVVGNDVTAASVAATSFPNPALVDYIDGNTSANYFDFSKTINVPSGSMSTSASTGGTALPAQVWQYLPIYVGGVLKKIPVYNA